MSTTRFDAFEADLKRLCRTHEAALAVTIDGRIGVWDLIGPDRPVYDLVDCQRPLVDDGRRAIGVPDGFVDSCSASMHEGFVSKERSRQAALHVARWLPGAKVVPIGSGAARREWAVIGRSRMTERA